MADALPHVPDLPDSCQFDRLVRDWCDAIAAYNRRDAFAVATAFYPPDLGEVETFTRLCGLVTFAAYACGAEHRKAHPPSPFGFYAVRIENVITGADVDPFAGMAEANIVAAGRLITAAANNDHEQLSALVQAHLRFDGAVERSGVLLDLLSIYCAMAANGEARSR